MSDWAEDSTTGGPWKHCNVWMSDLWWFISLSNVASPSAPEVSAAAVDDSAMEVCGIRAGSENLGTCIGRRSSAWSSALKYYFCLRDDFSRRYKVPERRPKMKNTMNTSLTVPVMYPAKVPLACNDDNNTIIQWYNNTMIQ